MHLLTGILLLLTGILQPGLKAFPMKSIIDPEADSTHVDCPECSSRVATMAAVQTAGYALVLTGLSKVWYSDYPRSSFHFHNDSGDWLQMDKLGHMATTYHLSRVSAKSFQWAGATPRQSAWYGAISGTAFLTAVEVLDGFSEQWGFSLSDMGANLIGSAVFVAQELTWEEQKVTIKYSYQNNKLTQYRPDLLGDHLSEKLIKDYNGMTFWLSANLHSLAPKGNRIPEWLNLAIGHGAYGMLGSSGNPATHQGVDLPELERYRQWYIAPDIDLSRIPVESKVLGEVFDLLNFLKIPAPALQYDRVNGWSVHLIFF